MTIVPYDKRKELSTPIEPTHIFILTQRGIKQKDIIDGRVSTRKLKPNRAIKQDIKDLEDKIEIYKQQILDLEIKISDKDLAIVRYETLFKENEESIKYLHSLESFRDMFVLKCMIKTGSPITIIQCSGIIKRRQCKFVDTCKDRVNILEMLL